MVALLCDSPGISEIDAAVAGLDQILLERIVASAQANEVVDGIEALMYFNNGDEMKQSLSEHYYGKFDNTNIRDDGNELQCGTPISTLCALAAIAHCDGEACTPSRRRCAVATLLQVFLAPPHRKSMLQSLAEVGMRKAAICRPVQGNTPEHCALCAEMLASALDSAVRWRTDLHLRCAASQDVHLIACNRKRYALGAILSPPPHQMQRTRACAVSGYTLTLIDNPNAGGGYGVVVHREGATAEAPVKLAKLTVGMVQPSEGSINRLCELASSWVWDDKDLSAHKDGTLEAKTHTSFTLKSKSMGAYVVDAAQARDISKQGCGFIVYALIGEE